MMYQTLQPENIPKVKKNNMIKLTTYTNFAQCNNHKTVLMVSKAATTKQKN